LFIPGENWKPCGKGILGMWNGGNGIGNGIPERQSGGIGNGGGIEKRAGGVPPVDNGAIVEAAVVVKD
jgi:hypothetical protein